MQRVAGPSRGTCSRSESLYVKNYLLLSTLIPSSVESNAMVFHNCRNIDTRESTFISIGGDQINHYYCASGVVHNSPSGCNLSSNNISLLTTHSKIPPERRTVYYSGRAVSLTTHAIFLVNQISNTLSNLTDSSNNYLDLEHLRITLQLVGRAIELYHNRPFGRSLTNAITPEVWLCEELLQELHGRVHGTWVGLLCTRISDVWRLVFRGQWVGDEFASLKRRLRDNRKSFENVLTVLNLYVSLSFMHRHLLRVPKRCADGS